MNDEYGKENNSITRSEESIGGVEHTDFHAKVRVAKAHNFFPPQKNGGKGRKVSEGRQKILFKGGVDAPPCPRPSACNYTAWGAHRAWVKWILKIGDTDIEPGTQ